MNEWKFRFYVLLLLIGAVAAIIGLIQAAHGDAPPVLPAVHIRRELPALKLLLRDNHTVVTVKENAYGVQINISDLQIPKT